MHYKSSVVDLPTHNYDNSYCTIVIVKFHYRSVLKCTNC